MQTGHCFIILHILDEKNLDDIKKKVNQELKVTIGADTSKATSDVNKLASELSRLSQQKTMQTWANNNSKAMKIWGGQVNDIITKMGSLDKDMSKVDFQNYVKQFTSIQNEAIRTGNIGKTFGDKMKTAWEKLGGLDSIRLGAGLFDDIKNFGRPIMFGLKSLMF